MARNLSNGRPRRVVSSVMSIATLATVGLLGLSGACDKLASVRQQSQASGYVETDSMGAEPRDISSVETRGPRELDENSGAAMSSGQPGVFFTINDSGNEPELFALDTTGAARGVWSVLGTTNVDWEAIAVGPCVTGAQRGLKDRCVYIGDVGDNGASHANRAIYRVREPVATGVRASIRADVLRYSYADGPHDVEAMYLAPTGDIVLITKRALADDAARLRPALVFVLAASAWRERTPAVAVLVDSLPLVPGSAPLRTITDASLAPDGRHLAVRTYAQVYVFATESSAGRLIHTSPPALCNIVSLGEPQGEGISWVNSDGRLLFTSEGRKAPMHLASCPLP